MISLFVGVLLLAEGMISCGKGKPDRAPLRTNLPIIDSISPSGGPVGTVVTIYGKNLGNSSTQVTVNGKSAGNKAPSDTKFMITVSDSTGTGNVIVKNAYGQTSGPVFTYVFTTSWMVSTFAGSTGGYTEGTGTAAKFNNPRGIAIDASGNLYVADAGNHRIRRITVPGAVVSTLAGSGVAGFLNATGTAAQFNTPTAVAVDPQSNVYVTDGGNNRIRKISSGVVTTLAGSGLAGFADGLAAVATFTSPAGIYIPQDGTLYIGDVGSHKIRKITTAGTVTTLAGSGIAGFTNATGVAAQFHDPTGITMDASGNLYVGDFVNQRIRKVTNPAAVVTTHAGSGTAVFLDATPGTAAGFSGPLGMTIDASGNLYVADYYNHRIRKISGSQAAVTNFAGIAPTGGNVTGGNTDGDALTKAAFNNPAGIVVDAQGNFYVADAGNNRIRKISSYKH